MSKIINLHNSINKYFSNFEAKYLENIILDKNYNILFDHPSFAMLIIVNYISALCIKGFYYVKKYLFLYCTI